MLLEETICDICHKPESSLLFPASAHLETTDPAVFYSSYPAPAEHFEIIRCKNCGLVRSRQRDDFKTRSDYYASRKIDIDDCQIKNQIKNYQLKAKRITGDLIPGNNLLDINCTTGIFCAEAIRLGWKVVGIDPSEQAIVAARRRSPWGHFYIEHVESAIFPAETFDTITFWNGFECTDSPRKILERLTPWLIPGGELILKLSNIESMPAHLMGPEWPLLRRKRLWYFSPVTITRLLSEAGYEAIKIHPVKSCFSLKDIGSRLVLQKGWVNFIGKLMNLPCFLGNLPVWVSTGEMEVWARIKQVTE